MIEALERTNRLLAQTETQLYGPQGLADEARRTAGELRAVLGEARTNLEKLDRILADVGRIASNARGRARIWMCCGPKSRPACGGCRAWSRRSIANGPSPAKGT